MSGKERGGLKIIRVKIFDMQTDLPYIFPVGKECLNKQKNTL